jgi:zinc/manganese transport system substrate-binding protein
MILIYATIETLYHLRAFKGNVSMMKHLSFIIVLWFTVSGIAAGRTTYRPSPQYDAAVGTRSAALAAEPVLHVVTTTTIIADVARSIGGDLVEVTSIIPLGADDHSYTPSSREVAQVADADIVLMNGLFLEESLIDILEANAEPVIISFGVTVLDADGEIVGVLGEDADCEPGEHEEEHEHGRCDPHVWMNPANVMIWAENIRAAFAGADPANADTYAANAEAYIEELENLDAELTELVSELPEEQRILVTNHEFLGYFAAAYDFEVIGTVIPGISTIAEVDPRSVAQLVERIRETGVPAIFAETSLNSDLAETVAAEVGREVAVVSLYSASLSDEDGPASTYIDYMRYNVTAIVEALSP